MKKLIAILTLALPLALQAQPRQELSVRFGEGISYFNYGISDGSSKIGRNVLFGAGYAYFFNPQWGMEIATQLSFLNGQYVIDSYTGNYEVLDSDAENFNFDYSLQNYNETHRTTVLQFPVMARFNTAWNGPIQLYAGLGVKIGFPLFNTSKRSIGSLQAAAFYEGQEEPMFDYLASEGFGTFEDIATKDKQKLSSVLLSVAAEIGVRFELSDLLGFSAGVYCDYGMNNLYKSKPANGRLVDYAKQREGAYTPEPVYGSLSKKVLPLETGIKLALLFIWEESN